MRATFYSDEQLIEATRQMEKDYNRLYPEGQTDNPLYESLNYHKYLCKERGIFMDKRNVVESISHKNITKEDLFELISKAFPEDEIATSGLIGTITTTEMTDGTIMQNVTFGKVL